MVLYPNKLPESERVCSGICTNWDYGKNGKGYYNDIFAPGWVVASLWELLSPGRAENFLK